MSRPTLRILQPGMLTTVQDRGRYGYQRFGVPVSGAMDEFALRVGNVLVGNDQGAAGLEVTISGPEIEFLDDAVCAVTGGDLSPMLDGEAVPGWQAIATGGGSTLKFGETRDGVRSYLTIAGGVDVPVVLGSRSTYLNSAFGGFEGRPLAGGDILDTFPTDPEPDPFGRELPSGYASPVYGGHHNLRVVLGPQSSAFSDDSVSLFLKSRYKVALDSDRMGYRLEGPPIPHRNGADIVSDGNPLGAVQVPGEGSPTILLADRGTTGGYTKIATVIAADIGKIAQAMPGQAVAFQKVTIEEAQKALMEREAIFGALERALATPAELKVLVDGTQYDVTDGEGSPLAARRRDGDSPPEIRNASVTVDGETFEFEVSVGRKE